MKKPFPMLSGLLLPLLNFAPDNDEKTGRRIRPEFSQAYFHWNQIKDHTWEPPHCDWDSILEGAHYEPLRVEPLVIPGFRKLSLYSVRKEGNMLRKGTKTMTIGCADGPGPNRKNHEYFLIGTNQSGQIKYISGTLILNEIFFYLEERADRPKIAAAARLFFLEVTDLKLIREHKDSYTFGGYSASLKKNVRLEMNRGNIDEYCIYVKGQKNHPRQCVGNYSRMKNGE